MAISGAGGELLGWLDQQQPAMVELLRELVNIDSGSFDHAGVDRVGEALRAHLDARGIAAEVIERPGAAFCLKADIPAAPGSGPAREAGHVLLLGHRDTVFPAGEAHARPFRIEGDLAYGPGVADMKSGLVLNTFVFEAFHRFGGNRHPLRILYTSDEEIGSPASKEVIEQCAGGARAVFNAEPGRTNGNVVTGRKGAMFAKIEVEGIAAHSGVAHAKGASAILELCRKVVELHGLTDYESGTTVNVGLISGGQSVNTVAPKAAAEVDVRFRTIADMANAEEAIKVILARRHVPGTATRITGRSLFQPFEQSAASRALFELYVKAAAEFGLAVGGEYTGGSSDAGFTSVLGVPTLCGTGPIGEHSHRQDEACHLSSFLPRAKTLALAILRLDQSASP